jgi:glyoxylase-like metal-dependent hydrolase (beta-lactamase superfamily II)
MKKILAFSSVLMGVLMVFLLAADDEFKVTRLGEKAALFQIGRESTINIIVLASRRGLVVIDTGILPSRGAALRSAIEREFGRSDFAYIINTHSHFDHTDGNQAFADVPIVGHQNAVREMNRSLGSPGAVEVFLRSRAGYQSALENELKTATVGSRDETRIREQLARNGALIDDFRQGRFILTRPTVLFSDRLTLDLGDLTLNLIYFGRAHTESDILIHVPELRLLVVGDLFQKDWLPTFSNPRADVPRWFEALYGLPAGLQAVERAVGGHSEPMSGDDLRAKVVYLRDVWDGVAAARRDGLTLAVAKERMPFDNKNPALAGLIRTWQGQDFHLANIEAAWRMQSESTAQALESLIASRGLEEGVAEYRKTIVGDERYNVAEDELNALGYRYLQSGRTAEAVAVFEINAEAFPRSWNVWDSLAEAHFARNDQDKAEEFYKKSVELNPENQNAKKWLNLIQGYRLNAAGETHESLRLSAGSWTALQGLYLGHKPPGLTPEIFAQAVISTGYHEDGGPAFTPDLSEIYFRIAQPPYPAIFFLKQHGDGWSAPQTASFSGRYADGDPFISIDGQKLFFSSNRPLSGQGQPKEDEDIWYVERLGCSWSEPRNLGGPVNSDQSEWKPSLSENGNLYFTSKRGANPSGWKIFCSKWTGHEYSEPIEFDEKINGAFHPICPCIARDEHFLVFAAAKEVGKNLDLYVTFKGEKGGWSFPINLGERINSDRDELFPILSPDNAYLFFTSWKTGHMNYSPEQRSYKEFKKIYDSPANGWGGDIYWVSAKVIDELRPNKPN